MNIGRNIIALRKHFRLSQQEMAFRLGISKATISLWENEKKYPSRKNIEKITAEFQLETQELFGSELEEVLQDQVQFKFRPRIHLIKGGVELHIHMEKLSVSEVLLVDKAVEILKALYS